MSNTNSEQWERDLIEKLALSGNKLETRRQRWGNFFKILVFVYLFAILAMAVYPLIKHLITKKGDGHTAVIEINGVIAAGKPASANNIIKSLKRAYEDGGTKGIILKINSPGGSPVQSDYVNKAIQQMKKAQPDIPVYAVVTDMCASGGYYIAVAADKIYVNENSIVGSIGVLFNSFGAVDLMKKIGVERRLITAGEHKGMLDPFSPVNEYEQNHLKSMLAELHTNFINVVKKGRGARLHETDQMFSGLFWSGGKSVELGLTDGINSTTGVAKDIIKAEDLVDFTARQTALERFAKKVGVSMGETLLKITGFEQPIKM